MHFDERNDEPMLFIMNRQLRELEQFMQCVPNFPPKGHGILTEAQEDFTETDEEEPEQEETAAVDDFEGVSEEVEEEISGENEDTEYSDDAEDESEDESEDEENGFCMQM